MEHKEAGSNERNIRGSIFIVLCRPRLYTTDGKGVHARLRRQADIQNDDAVSMHVRPSRHYAGQIRIQVCIIQTCHAYMQEISAYADPLP